LLTRVSDAVVHRASREELLDARKWIGADRATSVTMAPSDNVRAAPAPALEPSASAQLVVRGYNRRTTHAKTVREFAFRRKPVAEDIARDRCIDRGSELAEERALSLGDGSPPLRHEVGHLRECTNWPLCDAGAWRSSREHEC
jgi:hypothetical protein